MKRTLSLSLFLAIASILSAQQEPSTAPADKDPRFALHDFNKDGWDDLWQHLFPEIDVTQPSRDEDGDGKSNFEEMLDFTNPYAVDEPARILSPQEIRAARLAAVETARAADAKKISRFHAILEERGVLVRPSSVPPEDKEHGKDGPAAPTMDQSEESEGGAFNDVDEGSGGAWPQMMLCSTGGGPATIFSERLSAGDYLLAWEGDPERLFSVEWSDDMENWKLASRNLPTIAGIGTWGQFSPSPRRFYRVVEETGYATLPSDPSGGNGVTSFGATLSPEMVNGAPSSYLITANLPPGLSATAVELVINGETHAQCTRTGNNNIFRGFVGWSSLLEGTHTAHAVVHAISETTAVLVQEQGGIFRSAATSFTQERKHRAVGFRVSEAMIAPDDPDMPADTEIAVDIPYNPQGIGWIRIRDDDGNLVREWEWGHDDYPLAFRTTWDGTDHNGSQVPGGRYGVELEFGGDGFEAGPIHIAAGQRTWDALCLTETLGNWKAGATWENFRPSWAPHYSSSGGAAVANAWGPWEILSSPGRIVDEVRGRVKGAFGLGSTGTWKVRFWQSDSRFSDPIPDPVAAFVAGGNPFNNYDLGIFIGHGVACGGGTVAVPGGPTHVLPPQHYYPLVLDRATGAAHWVRSGSIPKYGAAASKLKWMFLITCNPLLDNGPHAIYNQNKGNGTLPFGDGLRVLCGYKSKIRVESGMGTKLSEGLIHKVAGEPYRDGTVMNAWGHVWNKSSNRSEGKVARAVYWAECENDRIHGAKPQSNIPLLQPHASQAELKETDFIP